MKGREGKGAAPPADLLVCFPSRAHLSFMTPKRICSPARPSEPNKRRHRHHHHHNHQLRKSGTRGGAAGQASPLSWAKNKQIGSEISEPTSPKVTCAGQIKVRPKSSACKSWQSVMEEIERIHNHRKHKKRSNWVESLGLKKEIMQFLTCLRSIRFDLRCFGNFPRADITSEDDDEEQEEEVDEEYHESNENAEESDENSRTVFSKWYMVLQENQGHGFCKEEREERKSFDESEESVSASSVPPANALFLMRCRSAPAKSWLEEKQEQQVAEEIEEEEMKEEKKSRNLRSLMEEEKKNNKEKLVVMRYNTDFYKLSSDIAKETWVVGGMRDLLSRSRSSKR